MRSALTPLFVTLAIQALASMAGLTVPSLVSGWGWQQALVVVAGLCAVMAALSQPVRGALDGASADDRRAQAPSRRRGVFEPLRMILERPPLRDIALCSFFYSAVQLTVTTYMVIWLTEVYRMEFLLAGVVMAFAQGAGVVGRLLWGWLADRHVPPRVLLSFLGLIMAACMAGYAMTGPDWALGAVLVIAIASGATAIGWNGVYLAEVARLSPPGMAGMLTGGTLFFTYFGVVTVPPALAGIIGATGSFAVAFGAVAVITLAVAAYIGLTRPRLVAN